MLDLNLILSAYCQGVFPMADRAGRIRWYDPDPRAIVPLGERFHVPKRLARTLRHRPFELRVDSAFRLVMESCAELNAQRNTTWISARMIDAYTALHRLGFAHSVESWAEGKLVGGLYGIAIGGLFAGDSMFSRQSDASKVALIYLVERLRRNGFQLLDTQILNEHMAQFGAIEIPRDDYKRLLAAALDVQAQF